MAEKGDCVCVVSSCLTIRPVTGQSVDDDHAAKGANDETETDEEEVSACHVMFA